MEIANVCIEIIKPSKFEETTRFITVIGQYISIASLVLALLLQVTARKATLQTYCITCYCFALLLNLIALSLLKSQSFVNNHLVGNPAACMILGE